MTLSGIELASLVKLAIAVAASDGNFADEERAALALEITNFGVKPNEVEGLLAAAQAIDAKDALTVISMMNYTQKKYAAAFLAVIIAADGKILSAEVRVWQLISSLCNLPTMTIAEGVDFWSKN